MDSTTNFKELNSENMMHDHQYIQYMNILIINTGLTSTVSQFPRLVRHVELHAVSTFSATLYDVAD